MRAADFAAFIGARNYLTIDREHMSGAWLRQNPHHAELCSGVVTGFTVRRVFTMADTVEILVDLGDPNVAGGTLMHLSADELAIRMEDA